MEIAIQILRGVLMGVGASYLIIAFFEWIANKLG